MSDYPYDPWQKCKTISGLAADEVISALQKEIRRNNLDNAVALAYEMFITSEDLEDYLWYRLKVISVEDIGFADTNAPILISTLDQMRKTFKGPGDRGMFVVHAVRYLCKSLKDRSSDEMYNWVKREYIAGNLRPQIPDYALDKHTLRGQQNGRGDADFYNTSSVVSPEWKDREKTYRERILEAIKKEEL